MTKILLAAASIIAATTSLHAADLGRKPTSPQFNAQPIATWTGFYVGVNAGYGQNDFKYTEALPGERNVFRQKGGLVGVTLGYNHEFANRMVLGVEADYALSGIKKTEKTSVTVGAFRQDSETQSKTTSFGTARLRAGYSFGSFMPYVTGGLALITSKIEGKDSFFNAGALVGSDSTNASKTLVGYTVGAGVEAMVTSNVSLKVEYLYAGFGTSQYTFTDSTGTSGRAKFSNSMHIGRVGLNYRF